MPFTPKVNRFAPKVPASPDPATAATENPPTPDVTKETAASTPSVAQADENVAKAHAEADDAFHRELYDPTKRTAPIKSIEEKWRLLPAFLKVKGLVKQHLDSFNYFVDVELKKILQANKRITIEEFDDFFLEYLDIRVGTPNIIDMDSVQEKITPHQCRLRDLTYSAPITVDVRYTLENKIVERTNVEIGRLPIMLGSNKCLLYNMSDSQLTQLGECPQDPGGYFIVRGTEKVILIHEQISKNRIILERDSKGFLCASVTSSTHKSKSKTYVYVKNNNIFMKHNSFSVDIPVVIVMKALGAESDQEIVQLVGSEMIYLNGLTGSLEQCSSLQIHTKEQALVRFSLSL